MAELVTFPGNGLRPLAAYQLRLFAPDGRVRPTVSIQTRSDSEAREQARRLSEGCRAELWSGGRLLEELAPGDHPVASSIRLLSCLAHPDTEADSSVSPSGAGAANSPENANESLS